jgi:hypothetical protein
MSGNFFMLAIAFELCMVAAATRANLKSAQRKSIWNLRRER